MDQQLSPNTKAALDKLSVLKPEVLNLLLALVNPVIAAASARTPEQSARACQAIYEGIQAARALGFTSVQGPDNKSIIVVSMENSTGTRVTYLLPDAAYGKRYSELISYGINVLEGALLLPHDDFVAVVGRLCEAIRGMTVVEGVLDTDNTGLQKAYRIVTEGVRTSEGRYSWARFKFDEANAVVGFATDYNSLGNNDSVYCNDCALFGLPDGSERPYLSPPKKAEL